MTHLYSSMVPCYPRLLTLMSLSILILLLSTGRTCDLLLTKNMVTVMDVTSVTMLHKIVMYVLPKDLLPCWLQWSKLLGCELWWDPCGNELRAFPKPIANKNLKPSAIPPTRNWNLPTTMWPWRQTFSNWALRWDHSLSCYLKAKILKQKTWAVPCS